ncbi:MAG: RNA polymerase factor sigma-32 [Alphaproteobacteria bacterium]|nr:RNA polymerase factor sigma-32 [Alphaproteobacteria bacterium]
MTLRHTSSAPSVRAELRESGQQDFVRAAMAEPLLEREEEADLARRWRDDGDEVALHKLTRAHMRLVVSLAAKYRRYGLPMADLIQEGNIGLMKAAERFEPERDVRFSTYVSWWIRSCIQDYVLRNWSIVRTGTTSAQKSLFFNLRRLRAQIGDVDNAALTPENRTKIATELKVRESDVDAMAQRLSASDRSLNAPVGDEENSQWQDFLVDENAVPEEAVMESTDTQRRKAWLGEAMTQLNDRERFIIAERRLTEDGSTLESLGKVLGISKERVRQIENAALTKLRKALVTRVGDPAEAGLIPSA